MAALTAAKVQHVRIDAPWPLLEPTQGVFSKYLANLDAFVASCETAGIGVLLVTTYTPSWANGGQAQNIPPTSIADYAAYAAFLAARWPSIEAIEVWNEPDLSYSWDQSAGTVACAKAYVALLRAGHAAIKAANPKCHVVAPAIGLCGSSAYIDAFFTFNGKAYCDVISAHMYGDPPGHGNLTPVQIVAEWWKSVGSVITQYAQWYPIWITETGWNTIGVTEAEQAANLTGIYAALSSGVGRTVRVYWYEFTDDTESPVSYQSAYGLLSAELSPKLSLQAFTSLLG